MITMKQYMEIINYRITEGSDYYNDVYGRNAYSIDCWNGKHDGYSMSLVFDTDTQCVYEMTACDYKNDRAYRLINPEFKNKRQQKPGDTNAWDGVDYIDLDVDADMLEKAKAIVAGIAYDTRVQVEIELSDDELLKFYRMAHERDITLNQLVEIALRDAMNEISLEKEQA